MSSSSALSSSASSSIATAAAVSAPPVHSSAPPSSSSPDTAVRGSAVATTPQSTMDHQQQQHVSPPPSSSGGDHKFTNGSTTPSSNGGGGSGGASGSKGKRVFVFQKRWLHSLPIMEKTLPESASDTATKKDSAAARQTTPSSSSSSPTGSSSANNSAEASSSSREVIACMLCDEPGSSSHHLTRVWSRMNCRRGRIENHLTSKHPEFMLLLKHKRDSEGDLAVQLFLQGMRDGRCSIRSEINLGLYNHIQSLNAQANADASSATLAALTGGAVDATAAELAHLQQSAKRGFPAANVYTIRDSGFANSTAISGSTNANANTKPLSIFPPLGSASKVTMELLELENRRKRARLTVPSAPSSEVSSSSSPLSGGGASKDQPSLPGVAAPTEFQVTGAASESAAAAPGRDNSVQSLEATVFAQWQSVFFNKLVVVTGGENEFITSLATNLWLLGANVLLTFTNISAQAEFTASHVARFPDPDATSSSAENHRGVMLSILCSFQTRRQIDEWSRSVADKFSRVDFLINFVDEEDDKKKNTGGAVGLTTTATEQQQAALASQSEHEGDQSNSSSAGENLVSSANRLLELCQSISTLCFQATGAGSIINITTQSDGVRRSMNCAAVETMTKSLALELQPLNVQVNCILLQQISVSADTEQQQQPPPPLQQDQLAAQDQQNAALSHTILFLLSPASASVSGSVLRLQHRTNAALSPPQLASVDTSNTNSSGSSSIANASLPPPGHAAEGSAVSTSDPAAATSETAHVDDDRQMLI